MIIINNGIRIKIINENKFKTITMAVLIRSSLNKKDVTLNALLLNVLKRGCKKYPSIKEIYKRAEELDGAVFDCVIIKKGEEQILEFSLELLQKSNLVSEGIEFLSNIITEPYLKDNKFDKNYVESEKEKLKDSINSKINDKKNFAKLKCIENMCSDEPFSIYGDGYIEDLENIDEQKLYRQYQKIMSTSEIEIIIVGEVSENEIHEAFKKYFNIENRNVLKTIKADYMKEKSTEKIITDTIDINQGKLCIGIRCNVNIETMDYYKLLVINELFGGSANSRLFSTVREKESLCYYINSFVYRSKGILFIQSGIDNNDFEKTVDIIKKEFDNIKNNDFKQKEIEDAITSLRKRYRTVKDYPYAIIDFYVNQIINNDSDNIDDVYKKITYIDNIENVLDNSFIDTIYFLKGGTKND